jgi:hypothetical protein
MPLLGGWMAFLGDGELDKLFYAYKLSAWLSTHTTTFPFVRLVSTFACAFVHIFVENSNT